MILKNIYNIYYTTENLIHYPIENIPTQLDVPIHKFVLISIRFSYSITQ